MKKILVIALAIVVAFAGAAFADANRTFVSLSDVLDGLRGGAEQTAGNSYAMVVYVSGGNEALTSVALDAAGKPLLRGLALNVFAQRIGAGDQSIADFLDSIGGGEGGGSFIIGSSEGTYNGDAWPGMISVGPDGKVYITDEMEQIAWFNPDGSFGGYIEIDPGAFEDMDFCFDNCVLWGPDGKLYASSWDYPDYYIAVIDPDGWVIEHVYENTFFDPGYEFNCDPAYFFTPDGDLIISCIGPVGPSFGSTKHLAIVDIESNGITDIIEVPSNIIINASAPLILSDGKAFYSSGSEYFIFDLASPGNILAQGDFNDDFDWGQGLSIEGYNIAIGNNGWGGNTIVGPDGRIYTQFSDWGDSGLGNGLAIFEIGIDNTVNLVKVLGSDDLGLHESQWPYGMSFSSEGLLYYMAETDIDGDYMATLVVLDPTVLWD